MENKVYLTIPKREITYLTKIIEGFDNLGVVSTIDAEEGRVMIHLTPDTRAEILKIIAELPFVEDVRLEENEPGGMVGAGQDKDCQ